MPYLSQPQLGRRAHNTFRAMHFFSRIYAELCAVSHTVGRASAAAALGGALLRSQHWAVHYFDCRTVRAVTVRLLAASVLAAVDRLLCSGGVARFAVQHVRRVESHFGAVRCGFLVMYTAAEAMARIWCFRSSCGEKLLVDFLA